MYFYFDPFIRQPITSTAFYIAEMVMMHASRMITYLPALYIYVKTAGARN